MDDHDDIPPVLVTAWGLRARGSRGPRPGLSVERIVAAGIAVAGEHGLAALSMNRVAAELGTSAMSLYRYVASKDELLTLMMDAAGDPPPEPAPADQGWRAGLADWAHASMAVMVRHRWFVQVPISGPPLTPVQVVWLERGLAAMWDTPLAESEKLDVILLVNGFVRNEASREADLADALRGTPELDLVVRYGELLGRLTDAAHYPAIHRLIGAGVFSPDQPEPVNTFEFRLSLVLDGVGALIASRTRGTRAQSSSASS